MPVRNVPPAANERDHAGQTGEVTDDVVGAPLGAGVGEAEVAGTDPPGTLTCQTGHWPFVTDGASDYTMTPVLAIHSRGTNGQPGIHPHPAL